MIKFQCDLVGSSRRRLRRLLRQRHTRQWFETGEVILVSRSSDGLIWASCGASHTFFLEGM
jgi:hypothetical protein